MKEGDQLARRDWIELRCRPTTESQRPTTPK